jgi:DNA-binding Xre family transcriptional regulator
VGWIFQLDPLLADLNARRAHEGRAALSWSQIAPLLGMSRQSLQNLASNRELKATNTRFIEAICRFFQCRPEQVLVLAPELDRNPVCQDEVDRLVALGRELEPAERPPYHVEVLNSETAAAQWLRVRNGQRRD